MIFTKHYGTKVVLDRKKIEIERGKKYLLWGKSGIGKTTLIRILSGLESNEEDAKMDSGRGSVVFQ